jgi:diguanylate cyclase (GGDEF)-like protein
MHTLECLAIDKVNLGIIIIDQEFNIVLWNSWLIRWTGYSAEAMIGKNLLEVYPRFASKTYLDILNNALCKGQSRFCSGALHNTFIPPAEDVQYNVRQNMLVEPIYDGGNTYVLIQITDMTGHYTRVKGLKNIIKEIELEYEQVKASEVVSIYQALHDPLTGLPNRNLFNDRVDSILQLAKRNGEKFAVVFLDLDGFKEVNDSFGHEAGDLILQSVTQRLKLLLRSSDTLARLGGDEFLLLFPRIKSRADVITVATKINNDFTQAYSVLEKDVYLSASMGISIYPEDGDDARTLIRNADIAMYNIKNQGKNGFCFYSDLN